MSEVNILVFYDVESFKKTFQFALSNANAKSNQKILAEFHPLDDRADIEDVRKTSCDLIFIADSRRVPNGDSEDLNHDATGKILVAARAHSANKNTPILIVGVYPGRTALISRCAEDGNIIVIDSDKSTALNGSKPLITKIRDIINGQTREPGGR